jgi:hypothetical protein
MYVNKHRSIRHPMMGFGEFSDETQCSAIPIGDPYRRPGNYCATPDGGITTFNSDGSTYRAPGAVDPDPAHPASDGGTSWIDRVIGAIGGAIRPIPPTTTVPIIPPSGPSTTTIVLLGGAALAAVLLLRNR